MIEMPKIKICCIQNIEEALTAIGKGADAIGLVGAMPSGPGVISDDQIASIASSTPLPVKTFLLTSETDARSIVTHYKRVKTTTIQLVDRHSREVYADLRQALPGVELVQVIHVLNDASLDEALGVAPYVDALLLDSGNPGLAVKQLGGTGRTHNWEISRRIVQQASIPVFLAGGLHAGNVQYALNTVQPFGLDVCTGVRSGGRLDLEKLSAFISAVHG